MRLISVFFAVATVITNAVEMDDSLADCASQDQLEVDDRSSLLQKDFGMVRTKHEHKDSSEAKDVTGAHDKVIEPQPSLVVAKVHGKKEVDAGADKSHHSLNVKTGEEGWPGDLLKGIRDVVGGASDVDKKFEAVKAEVVTFKAAVHASIHKLTESVDADTSARTAATHVSIALEKINVASMKLWKSFSEVTTTFMTTIGKVAPDDMWAAVNGVLTKVSGEAEKLAKGFDDSAKELARKASNTTAICPLVKNQLKTMHKNVELLVSGVIGMSAKGLDQDIGKARDLLPDALKKQIDEVLGKANEAADKVQQSMPTIAQEISMGIAQALKGQCPDLKSASANQKVGLLSATILGASFIFNVGF